MPNILLADSGKCSLQKLIEMKKKEKNYKLRERYSAIIWSIGKKISATEIARLLHYSEQTVQIWIKAYNTTGVDGLVSKPTGRRPKKLNDEEQTWLLSLLEEDPEDYGFFTNIWDCKLLAAVCFEQRNIQVSDDTIWRLLKRSGYSFQQPQFQHPKADTSLKKKQGMSWKSWQKTGNNT